MALVVEGYFDVIKLHDAGVRCAVGVLGTAITIDQLQLCARCVSVRVSRAWGATAAAAAATERPPLVSPVCVGNALLSLISSLSCSLAVCRWLKVLVPTLCCCSKMVKSGMVTLRHHDSLSLCICIFVCSVACGVASSAPPVSLPYRLCLASIDDAFFFLFFFGA